MANFGGDDLDVGIRVTAEGQQIARQVANDVAGLRITLASLYQLQDSHYQRESARRSADAAAAAALRKQRDETRALAEAQRDAARAAKEQSDQLDGLLSKLGGLAAAFLAFQGFKTFIREGFEFNATIETSNLGIASLITAQSELTDSQGRVVTGTEKLKLAQELATDQVNKLRIAGLQTTATTQELVLAFQQAVGVGLRWGLTLDQIRVFAIQMSQAAGALGLPMNQLNEEIRDLLGGNISARNTRIATALGITNEQIRQAREAGNLFGFVTSKLEAFSIAGEATAKTFAGTMSNVKEALQNFAGDATQPIFDKLKVSAQSALEQIFDLKNARISDNFRGILDVAQEVFGDLGNLLANAIQGAVESAKDLSTWFAENRQQVSGILAAVGLLNGELTSTLSDVIGLAVPLADAGVRAGFFRSVLVGVGGVVATIHETFQLLVSTLGFIGNVVLSALIAPMVGWLKLISRAVGLFNEDLATSIDNVAESGATFLKANIEGLVKYNDQLGKGGLALDEYSEKIRQMDQNLDNSEKARQGRIKKAIADASGIGIRNTANTPKPGNPTKGAQGDILLAKEELSQQLRDLKILLDNAAISYEDYYAKVTAAQQDSIDKQLAAQQRLLAFTTDEGARSKILSTIKGLEAERLQVVEDNAEKLRVANEKLNDEVIKAQVQLLKDQGKLTEANALEVQAKYDKLVARLKINGKAAGAEIVTALFDIDTAKVRLEELTKASKIVTDQLALDLSGIQTRLRSGALSERQGNEQTVAAYTRAKAALEALLPDMERAAKLTGDPTQIAQVEQLRQKIEDMGTTIAHTSDEFIKLKDGGREALTGGLADFLDQAIEGAKSFHDIWKDVARGVVASLRKIASQMLANLIIQKALGFLGSLAGGVTGGFSGGLDIAGDAGLGGGVANVASGGYISGPGSSTSDSIPARLSNGEFVVRAEAVRNVGVEFLRSINASGASAVGRHRARGYADGGLVTAGHGSEAGGFAATIGLEEGLVARHMQTKAGTSAIINVIAANRKTVRGMLGPS